MFNVSKRAYNRIVLFMYQTVNSARPWSFIGVFITITFAAQIISGLMLLYSLSNDPMLIPSSRNTEDMGNLYTDDFFFIHERLVDVLFILLFLHWTRKHFLEANYLIRESSWKSGNALFILAHIAVFTGLVLCCTHLSDVTLKIATNIIRTVFLKIGYIGSLLYTDESLNTDTIVRLMQFHYVAPFLIVWVSMDHMVDMHYGHTDTNVLLTRRILYNWQLEIFKKELYFIAEYLFFLTLTTFYIYLEDDPLAYEMFMWGDIGFMNDVRYLGVAPHWYFRAYMAWLIFCPHHYIGIIGLIYIFIAIYYQPLVLHNNPKYILALREYQPVEHSALYQFLFLMFFTSCCYVCSYLPYGRFYTSIGGNFATTFSFIYIFMFLSMPLYDIILAINHYKEYIRLVYELD